MKPSALEIIAETEGFVAINKPPRLLSIPDREGKDISLKKILQEKYGSIFTVHRLDRDTSGVIVFAKDEATHKYLSGIFEDRTVEKYYTGLVTGVPPVKKGVIEAPIAAHPGKQGLMMIHKKGKTSLTEYEVMEEFGKFSLVEFRIHTGRTHQIRVHMQHLGHPIVCDDTYGDGQPVLVSSIRKKYNLSKVEEQERPILSRLALHSEHLKFNDESGKAFHLHAEMPKDMRALLQQLRKK